MNCPACGRRFSARVEVINFYVWCSNFACESKVANDGLETAVPWTQAKQDDLEKRLAERIESE
jgi:ribosomal protein L37AE/L43A